MNRLLPYSSPLSGARKTLAVACLTLLTGLMTAPLHAADSSPRVYSASYPEAPKGHWPELVFESDGRTYFQIAPGAPRPIIHALASCNTLIPVEPRIIGKYVVVHGAHKSFSLNIAGKTGIVSYEGDRPFSKADLAADEAHCLPKAKSTETAAVKAEPVAKAEPEKAKVEAKVEAKAEPVAPAAPPHVIKASDVTIYGALQRWSKDAGWQLSWESPKDMPVKLEASFNSNFETAVEELMISLKLSQYPLRACSFDNKALRVVHISKRCED